MAVGLRLVYLVVLLSLDGMYLVSPSSTCDL